MCSRLFVAAAVVCCRSAFAWGPHVEIGEAAVRVLPHADLHAARFGGSWPKVPPLGFLADWRGELREGYFTDDYLLFPGFPRHSQHIMPDVPETYGPYFRRAVQAIRTESPENAVRWIGAVMHFQQDSGSPPHAIGILGPLHTKMENWVDGDAVDITGYEPRLLGETVEGAVKGFEVRMQGLLGYSRERAVALTPILEGRTEREDQPFALECANETARVTADLLHTLLTLGRRPAGGPAEIAGTVKFRSSVPGQGAKVIVLGTDFSTVTDPKGGFSFRGLPSGRHQLRVMAFGCRTVTIEIELTNGANALDVTLPPDPVPGNRLRDADLQTFWVRDDRPDGWQSGRFDGRPLQETPWTRLPAQAETVRVRVEFTGDAVPVTLRLRRNPRESEKDGETPLTLRPVADTPGVFVAEVAASLSNVPERTRLSAQLLFGTAEPPQKTIRHVAIVPGGEGL